LQRAPKNSGAGCAIQGFEDSLRRIINRAAETDPDVCDLSSLDT
jgi:hypothetical protein